MGSDGMTGFRTIVRRALSAPLILAISFYRAAISPWLPPACRFTPTCSRYALEAIRVHGPFCGSWLTVRRLLRCHPFGPSGYDPVPPPRPRKGADAVG